MYSSVPLRKITAALRVDIKMSWHNDDKDFLRAKNRVQASDISSEDKQAIEDLVNKLLATKIRKRRAVKYYYSLLAIIQRGYLRTYHGVTEQDLYKTLAEIEHTQAFGGMAKRDYKIAIKRMLEHLNNPVAPIIKTAAKPQYLPKFFLTIFDILKMAQSDGSLRDRVISSCFFESNCRPHEFFMLKREDVRFESIPARIWDGNGGLHKISLDVAFLNLSPDSKTGARNPPLIFTVPWLKAWFASSHNEYLFTSVLPGRPDPEDIADRNKQLLYPAALKAVRMLAKRAGIEKWDEVTLYSFRHGMNTYLSDVLTNAQQCEHAGWLQGSDMPRVYIHKKGKSMVAPILAPFGIYVDWQSDERRGWLDLMKAGKDTYMRPAGKIAAYKLK